MEEERENFEFECPDCGTHILGYLTKCPKCGVEFVFEEVEETKCPRCGKNVASDAQTCPACARGCETIAGCTAFIPGLVDMNRFGFTPWRKMTSILSEQGFADDNVMSR